MIYLCLIEATEVPKFKILFKDKIVHFCLYFGLVYLWIRSIKNLTFNLKLIVLFLAIALGICIEFLQENLTTTRTFDYYDIVANTIGAFLSFMYVNRFLKIKN